MKIIIFFNNNSYLITFQKGETNNFGIYYIVKGQTSSVLNNKENEIEILSVCKIEFHSKISFLFSWEKVLVNFLFFLINLEKLQSEATR